MSDQRRPSNAPQWITAIATSLLVLVAFFGLRKANDAFRLENAQEDAARYEMKAIEAAEEVKHLKDFQASLQSEIANQQVILWKRVCEGLASRASNLGASSASMIDIQTKLRGRKNSKIFSPEWFLPKIRKEILKHPLAQLDVAMLQKSEQERFQDLLENFIRENELALSEEADVPVALSDYSFRGTKGTSVSGFVAGEFNNLLIKFFEQCKGEAPDPDTLTILK